MTSYTVASNYYYTLYIDPDVLENLSQSPPLKVIDLETVKAVSAEVTYLQEKTLQFRAMTGPSAGKPWLSKHNLHK